MQITPIAAQISCTGLKNNSKKIEELEQKHQRIQWASEGCTGSLSALDARELELRREYQNLVNKGVALQWASEGCNASLPAKDMARMAEIEAELSVIEPETAPITPMTIAQIYDVPKGNIYGVPDHTFYGEWAR